MAVTTQIYADNDNIKAPDTKDVESSDTIVCTNQTIFLISHTPKILLL